MLADSLPRILADHVAADPDRPAVGFLVDGERDHLMLSRAQLDAEVRGVAEALRHRLAPGARAALVYESGRAFVPAFLGCLHAGVVAVPLAPPGGHRVGSRLDTTRRVLADCQAELVLCDQGRLDSRGSLRIDGRLVDWLPTDDIGPAAGPSAGPTGGRPDSTAFIQYSSGSTQAPRGVVVTHGSLIANLAALASLFRMPAGYGAMVSWLPLFHDMGLIAALLQPLYRGLSTHLMSPLQFMQRPSRWVEAMSWLGATTTGAPNFAFELCARRVPDDVVAGLDLSSWEVAFCGAEPIRAATVGTFQERFGPAGFSSSAFVGCYGLAEATLMASGVDDRGTRILRASRSALEAGRVHPLDTADTADTAEVVSVGHVHDNSEISVVDPDTLAAYPERVVGEVWLRGPGIAAGYWRRADDTAATFRARRADGTGPWLRTGDLGFLHDGELYITGRIKDLLIIQGRNIHPHDVEDVAGHAHPGCRAGGVAVVEGPDGEVLVIQEVRLPDADPQAQAELAEAVWRAVVDACDLVPAAVHLVSPRTVLKTSSGKLRRTATRDALLAGALPVVHTRAVRPREVAREP